MNRRTLLSLLACLPFCRSKPRLWIDERNAATPVLQNRAFRAHWNVTKTCRLDKKLGTLWVIEGECHPLDVVDVLPLVEQGFVRGSLVAVDELYHRQDRVRFRVIDVAV